MTEITINLDQSLSVKWTGKKGRGSLFQIMAEGNAKNANKLTKEELYTCFLCAKGNPFPLGTGPKFYADILKDVQAGKYPMSEKLQAMELGLFRKAYVEQCGESCNGPYDSYLHIAAK